MLLRNINKKTPFKIGKYVIYPSKIVDVPEEVIKKFRSSKCGEIHFKNFEKVGKKETGTPTIEKSKENKKLHVEKF